jgi:hypothetical protein
MVMEDAAPGSQALFETVVFLNHFNDLPDPRQRGKVTYPLEEVLLLALLAVLAGAESFVEIARFGEKKLDRHCHGNALWPAGWRPARLAT